MMYETQTGHTADKYEADDVVDLEELLAEAGLSAEGEETRLAIATKAICW